MGFTPQFRKPPYYHILFIYIQTYKYIIIITIIIIVIIINYYLWIIIVIITIIIICILGYNNTIINIYIFWGTMVSWWMAILCNVFPFLLSSIWNMGLKVLIYPHLFRMVIEILNLTSTSEYFAASECVSTLAGVHVMVTGFVWK